ncbi:hypothetical protein SAMN05216474_0307 [Lishizhenia tianjinensis]|uniref:DUF4468 domain-containing protein n=1 Tax=Lishizhenia tianjinensis TaxID=477690 RepID=A0A1I6XMG2_9FLAO|nr:hypothetical protein [Lishizhenia tianjinensis]SFT39346.1 hypothetical protein SAMN05216474_0307 [Lishizhenia tianjinensis]
MKLIGGAILFVGIFLSFASQREHGEFTEHVDCNQDSCYGYYQGPEFIKGDDIAHQFSNTMSAKVGDQLKKLYKEKNYVKVDFNSLKMSTVGMGSGKVTYKLTIPFIKVSDSCAARTSFDHSGGWNHAPALSARKKQLQKALLPGENLDISPLTKTPEGLQEYWIQWRNKTTQAACAIQKK